ncbi:hypothetical protein [Bradyrhizobium prioriisuperbiae]|uniref:hypothetical protein n=1 Tax=Bradyrhizobium prioriisuperbiae TaxID=2854389 RepID=UPI0028E93CC3|nr:hypothetical protein [Bradyrhizobium prioritasuperba]
MRVTGLHSLLILATAFGASQAYAQAKKDTKAAPPANEVRYFTSIGGIMDDQADSILKETRAAGKVTGAVLDVCYPAIGNPDRKDRFVATLTVDGQKLTGTTQSMDGKQPVTVNLLRKSSGNGVSFDGKVTIGPGTSNISSADNTDISEKEFKEGQEADDEISAAPADFTSASPEAVAVRVKPDGIADFVNSLRGQNLEISLTSLLPSCSELRKGEQVIHINIDPERATDFVAKMKSHAGVIASGWTSGKLDMDRTVRFAAADWRDGSKVNRDKLTATISAVMAKALSAKALAPTWNDSTGEIKLTFKRPHAALPSLGLTQTIEFSAMATSDKPGASDKLLLWIGFPSITTTDESSGAKLKLSDASDTGGEESVPVDEGDTVTAIARELKAQRWDAENTSWK